MKAAWVFAVGFSGWCGAATASARQSNQPTALASLLLLVVASRLGGSWVGVQAATNPIVVKGNLFYDSITKKRFYIRGVTYAPNPVCTNYWDDAVSDDYSSPFLDWEADLRDMVK
jgi:hypothetical protein